MIHKQIGQIKIDADFVELTCNMMMMSKTKR